MTFLLFFIISVAVATQGTGAPDSFGHQDRLDKREEATRCVVAFGETHKEASGRTIPAR